MIKSYDILKLKINNGRSSIYQFLNFCPVKGSIEKQGEERNNLITKV